MKRHIIVLIWLSLSLNCSVSQDEPQGSTGFWQEVAAESLGFTDQDIAGIRQSLTALPNLKSALAIKGKELFWEHYANGADQDALLHIRSITKSISSLLVGLAIEANELENTEVLLETYFPEYIDEDVDARLKHLNIAHILEMKSGFEWNENQEAIPWYTTVSDPLAYLFSKPMASEPGSVFNYNSGAVSLLRKVLESSAEKLLSHLLEERLLSPLGISEYTWEQDGYGQPRADAGLSFRSRDLARIGYMLINQGHFQGQQVVPPTWVEESWSFETDLQGNYGPIEQLHYHRLWWMGKYRNREVFMGIGYGGQLLIMMPSEQLIFVANHEFRVANVQGQSTRFLEAFFKPIADHWLD